MEIKINKIILDNAIELVAKAIDQNPFIPVMKGVLIEAEDNKITLIGSNGEISIKHTINTSVDSLIITPGVALIELNMFRNIVKKVDSDLQIITNDNIMQIKSSDDIYTLNLYNNFDYPTIDFTIYGEMLKIKWQDLKDIAKNVWFAASQNEANLILCCVNISAKNKQLKMLATDRYRYAEQILPIENDINFNISLLSKNLKDLLSFEFNGDINLYISDHKIIFQIDNNIIQSKIVEQIYQDVSKIIPKDFPFTLTISKKEISSLLNKASVIINENYNKIRLTIKNNVLTLSSSRDEIANVVLKTKNFAYNGDELKLLLNGKFLKDAISVFDDEVNIYITKDHMRLVAKSNSNPNNIQLFTPQKGF